MITNFKIFCNQTRHLVDEFELLGKPREAFDQWFLDKSNTLTFNDLLSKTIFFYTGSKKLNEREAGFIIIDKDSKSIKFENSDFYYCLETDIGNVLHENMTEIEWNELDYFYFINHKDPNTNSSSLILKVVNTIEDRFLNSKYEYHEFVKKNTHENLEFSITSLSIYQFTEKCKKCLNFVDLNIVNMIDGEYECPYCLLSNLTIKFNLK